MLKALLIVSFVTLLGGVPQSFADRIRIGYLLDLSSKGAFVGQQSQAGALLAQRELAKQGVSIDLFFEDHRTEGKVGASGGHKLLDVDRVDALLCDLTPPCVAASPIAQEAAKVFLYQAPVDSIRASNSFAFRNFLDYEQGCFLISDHWKRQGIKKVGHLKLNAEFGDLCLRGAERAGINQVIIEYDPGTELRSIVGRLKAAGVEALLQTGYEGDYISQFRSASDLGLAVPTGLPQPLLTEAVIGAVTPAKLNVSVVFGFPHLDSRFVERLQKEGLLRNTTVAIESAAIAYSHVMQAVKAIQVCGRSDIRCQVHDIATSTAGELGFRGWQERVAIYPLKLRRFQNGRFIELNAEPNPQER